MTAPATPPGPAPWLTIVGIGEDGLDGLSPSARALVDRARVLIGGARHLALIPDDGRERIVWPSPLKELIPEIARRRGTAVCVLASGDPFCYGIGNTLARTIAPAEMVVVPAPSSFSLACARLGWALATVDMVTLHGRPLDTLHGYVQPGARLLILSENHTTPAAVAALLRRRGYGPSRLTVLGRMGGAGETRIAGDAATWETTDLPDLNTLAVDCVAAPGVVPLPRTPGLPDEAFRHDGQLTKRENRAVALAALIPVPGQLLWDVGAGCGSIAIEWMRSHPTCRAVAIERDAGRIALIAANAAALGCPDLAIVTDKAPAAFKGLARPDAIFIGGGITLPGLLARCWAALKPGGRLVANVVTLKGEQAVLDAHARLGGDLTRLSVARADHLGAQRGWKPLRTVTQYAVTKPWDAE